MIEFTGSVCDMECKQLLLCLGQIGVIQCRTIGKILLQNELSAVLNIDILQVEGCFLASTDRLGNLSYRCGTEGIIRNIKGRDLSDRICSRRKTSKRNLRLVVSLICHVTEGKLNVIAIRIFYPVVVSVKDAKDHLLFISWC